MQQKPQLFQILQINSKLGFPLIEIHKFKILLLGRQIAQPKLVCCPENSKLPKGGDNHKHESELCPCSALSREPAWVLAGGSPSPLKLHVHRRTKWSLAEKDLKSVCSADLEKRTAGNNHQNTPKLKQSKSLDFLSVALRVKGKKTNLLVLTP